MAAFDYATVAYDATTGSEQWVSRYDDPLHGDESACALAVNPTRSAIYVTGVNEARNGGYATVAYTGS